MSFNKFDSRYVHLFLSDPNEYMSFGLSKDDGRTDMNAADAVVAWVNPLTGEGKVLDYYLETKQQVLLAPNDHVACIRQAHNLIRQFPLFPKCVGSRGSCPDTRLQGGSDSLTLLHAAIVNGFSMVTFKRPQLGGNGLSFSLRVTLTDPIQTSILI